MTPTILVVFGGDSVEHEISIITAFQIFHGYKGDYNLKPIYLDEGNFYYVDKWEKFGDFQKNKIKHKVEFKSKVKRIKVGLKFISFEAIWLISHGKNCEDGTITSFFKTLHLPIIAMNTTSAAIGQNKVISKKVVSCKHLPYLQVTKKMLGSHMAYLLKKAEKIGYPVILKPCNLGSSVGVSVCKNADELIDHINYLFTLDSTLILEKCLQSFEEYSIAVLRYRQNLYCSEIEKTSSNHVLSYEDKYVNDKKSMAGGKKEMPAILSDSLYHFILNKSKEIYEELQCEYIVRIDYLYDLQNQILYFNEINNIPGSLSYYLFEPCNLSITKLVDMVLEEGLKNCANEEKIIQKYEENIFTKLDGNNFKLNK